MNMKSEPASWVIDKKIPIGIIAAIVAQTVAIGWWSGSVETRLQYVETSINHRVGESARLAVTETQVENFKETLDEIQRDIRSIEGKLDRR